MGRIFGRNDTETDVDVADRTTTRDDIEVVPDRDPVVIRDDRATRARVLADDEIRQEIVEDELERKGVVPHRRLGNAAATAGLLLGVIGTLMGVVPVLFPGAMVLGFVGLVASVVGRRRAVTHERRVGRKRGALGILFSLVAIGLGVVGMLIVADVINSFDGTIHDAVNELKDADARLGDWFN